MLKFLQKISLKNLRDVLFGIFQRFPLAAVFSLTAFGIMVSLIRLEDLSQTTENILLKLLTTLIVFFFFSVAMYIFTEKKGLTMPTRCYYQGFTLLFAGLFYYFFEEDLFAGQQTETAVYIALTVLGVVSFLFVSRYFYKLVARVESQEEYYLWTYEIVLKAIMSVIVGLSALALGFIALASVFTLFDFNTDWIREDHWFAYWASFSVLLLGPYYFLANFPRLEDAEKRIEEVAEDKFFSFLINYIALPAIYIYFIILYAYTVKVLLNFSDWPQGEVSWMVILFSFFGFLIYFASFAFVGKFKHAEFFRKILPYAVLLQTPMLFYAIGLRINQYDVTINRYLVVIFGLWLVYLSLYYILSKKKDLSIPFYSLLLIVIFMSIGPWSVYSVPEWRQYDRLRANLLEAEILQDGEIVPLESYSAIDAELSGDIYGGIAYLCNYHGCKTLEPLFAEEIQNIKDEHRKDWEERKQERIEDLENREGDNSEAIENIKQEKYREPSNWQIINELTQLIKVEQWNRFGRQSEEEPEYLRFENEDQYGFDSSFSVSGYDYFARLSSELQVDKELDRIRGVEEMGGLEYYAVMNTDDETIELYQEDEVLESYSIEESIIDQIMNNEENYIEPDSNNIYLEALLSRENMTFDLSGENYDLRVVLRSISIKNPDWEPGSETDGSGEAEEFKLRTMPGDVGGDGYVLIREVAGDDE